MSNGDGDHDYTTQRGDTNLPIPDPTRLTTQLVDRALAAFREVVFERMRGMDRASNLLADELVKLTDNLARSREHMREEFGQALAGLRESYELQIKNVSEVGSERFAAIATQFRERDIRTDQTDKERKISLDAALAAAKEAVKEQNTASALAIGKSEAGFKEKIDALVLLMNTTTASLQAQIADLKGRLDKSEGVKTGGEGVTQQHQIQSNWSVGLWVIAGLSLLGTASAIVISLVRFH